MKSPDKSPNERKAYAAPKLQRYGSVRSITRNNGTMGANHDGGMVKSKTS
jgi:hypothetical protein